jgi:hypothetical protein
MRRYRIDKDGNEQPAWASEKKLEQWGREEGARAFRDQREPTTMSNLTHDQAAWAEYKRLLNEKYGNTCS